MTCRWPFQPGDSLRALQFRFFAPPLFGNLPPHGFFWETKKSQETAAAVSVFPDLILLCQWAFLCRLNKTKFGEIFEDSLKQNSPHSEVHISCESWNPMARMEIFGGASPFYLFSCPVDNSIYVALSVGQVPYIPTWQNTDNHKAILDICNTWPP